MCHFAAKGIELMPIMSYFQLKVETEDKVYTRDEARLKKIRSNFPLTLSELFRKINNLNGAGYAS